MFGSKKKMETNLDHVMLSAIRIAEQSLFCIGKELFPNCSKIELLNLEINIMSESSWFNAICESGDTHQIALNVEFAVFESCGGVLAIRRVSLCMKLVRTHNIFTRIDRETSVDVILDSRRCFLVGGFPNEPHMIKITDIAA